MGKLKTVCTSWLAALIVTPLLAQPTPLPNPYPGVTTRGDSLDLTNQKGGKCSKATLPHITPDADGDLLVLRVIDSRGYDFEIWCHDASPALSPIFNWEWNFRLSYPGKNKTTLIDKCELPGGMNYIIMRFNKKLKKGDVQERGRTTSGGKVIRVKGRIRNYYHHNYNGTDDFHLSYDYKTKKMVRINTKRKKGGRKTPETNEGRETDTIAMRATDSGLLYADSDSGFAMTLGDTPAPAVQVAASQAASDTRHEIVLIEAVDHNEDDPPENLTEENFAFIAQSSPGYAPPEPSSCSMMAPVDVPTAADVRVDPFVVRMSNARRAPEFDVFHPSIVEIENIQHDSGCLTVTTPADNVGYVSLGVPKQLLGPDNRGHVYVTGAAQKIAVTAQESATHFAVSYDLPDDATTTQICRNPMPLETRRPINVTVEFTALAGETQVNADYVGDLETVTVVGVDGEDLEPERAGVEVSERSGGLRVSVAAARDISAILLTGRGSDSVRLVANAEASQAPPGFTWPSDGAVNIQNGRLDETFNVPRSIAQINAPPSDYAVAIGGAEPGFEASTLDVVAVRADQIALRGRDIPHSAVEDSALEIEITAPDGSAVLAEAPAWSYELSGQPVTTLNTWAPIFFQCAGLPPQEIITIEFQPQPWQRIEPTTTQVACGEVAGLTVIGQYQTSRPGPQPLQAQVRRQGG